MTRAIFLVLAFALAACSDMNVKKRGTSVVPVSGGETATMSPDDLVIALGRSGFSPDEILEYGPAIRNALAFRGGAELRQGGQLMAIISVMDGALYAVSQHGGTYIHELYN